MVNNTKLNGKITWWARIGDQRDVLSPSQSLVGECKAVYTNKGALPCQLLPKELNLGSFTLPCTISNLNLYAMANLGASVNVMSKLIFEHLKLANLKETNMVVEMVDMMKKAPLGIVENILIDVFKREISLGIEEDRVKFDMDGGICHSKIPVENFYMANSVHEEEYFNPLEIKDDELEDNHWMDVDGLRIVHHDHERQSVGGNCMIFVDFLKVRYGNKNIDDTTRERRYYEWVVMDSFDVEIDYGKTRDDPYSRRFDEYKEEFDNDIEQLANEHDLRRGKKVCLDDGGEIQKIYHDTCNPGMTKDSKGKSFVCITKQLDDALPLGRANGSRFTGMVRKEMNTVGCTKEET
ncbi:phospholipase-like protein [Tanacetum coccineum]|uniref:Phospholipase-like protein n=1 Tax=Tanacetum coccineum TaxID=301880 RepID=A0ABQ5AUY9_9ASTR